MPNYKPTIGLEIHAELKTKTKMFCSCPNDPHNAAPNENTCPICLAHPGTLPVPNKEAIDSVVLLGLALKGKISEKINFDRKSYFYPDLPKGYQISQYDHPIVSGGSLINVDITRVHLEEDTGTPGHSGSDHNLIDYNRAGVPLMELVTEPNITSSEEAVDFAKELQLVLRYLNISDADMEKGQMRVEVNISISDNNKLGTKVEIKNINSFKAVAGAISYEIKRQEDLLSKGKEVVHETRGWDADKQRTISQRSKEQAHDYRYFPEPDIPIINLSNDHIQNIKERIVELPKEKRKRFIEEFGLNIDQIDLIVEDKRLADFFEQSASELLSFNKGKSTTYKTLYNYLSSDLRGIMLEDNINISNLKVTPESFAHLVYMIDNGDLSSRLAKDVLIEMVGTGKDPESIKKDLGLSILDDESKLEDIAKKIIKSNEKAVDDFRKGKDSAIKFLVGQMMASTRGQADPEIAEKVLRRCLG